LHPPFIPSQSPVFVGNPSINYIQLGINRGANGSIDNLLVTVIPEPSAMVMLGLGGVRNSYACVFRTQAGYLTPILSLTLVQTSGSDQFLLVPGKTNGPDRSTILSTPRLQGKNLRSCKSWGRTGDNFAKRLPTLRLNSGAK